jgi:hypothetical protein
MYERIAAAFVSENQSDGLRVTCKINSYLRGLISGELRQIDLLIEVDWSTGRRIRTIADAKRHKRPLDIREVESLEAMMRDCQADHGILICPHGWTDVAKRRAQDSITMALLAEDQVRESSYWASFSECVGPCFDNSRPEKRGMVLTDQQHLLLVNGLFVIVWSGKCDRCHNFQIWCWDCGGKYSLGVEEDVICECERKWLTTIEVESIKTSFTKAASIVLHLEKPEGKVLLDRRSLS